MDIYPEQINVVEVKAMCDYKLWSRFNTENEKVFGFKLLLSYPAFESRTDPKVFDNVSLDHGVKIWKGGENDIDLSYLYNNAI